MTTGGQTGENLNINAWVDKQTATYHQRRIVVALIVGVLAFSSLACGARIQIDRWAATSTPTLLPTATIIPPTTTPTNTPTPRLPTPTAVLSKTAPARPTASSSHLRVLTELWNTIDRNYLYRDFNGLNWEAVFQKYRQKVSSGLTDDEFYLSMDEMVAQLGDEHSVFFNPAQAKEEDEGYQGEYNYVGIGVITNAVPERQRVTIVLVLPGSPAEEAGLQPHDSILAVDGEPILDENGDRRSNLRGPAGSQIILTVLTPGQSPRQVELTRKEIDSELPVPSTVFTSTGSKRIGYLLLPTFSDTTIPRKVRKALQELRSDGRLHGLIIDNRHNDGGSSNVFEDILAYFEDGKLGYFINRDGEEALRVNGIDLEGSQRIPLVVLIGSNTASFGEIFSGILKDTQRAHLIGETTDGNVEILYVYEFSDGSRAWIAHDRFQPLNHPDDDWEQTGIVPHTIISSNWDEVTLETDPAILAALNYFDHR